MLPAFLNPALAAAALACIAVPIIIHFLFRRRKRPVEFGAIRFLLAALRKQQRRLRLEQLLLLAARVALVALLALAVGRPVWSSADAADRGPRTLVLILDNSLTSQASPASTSDLALAKSRALELLSALDPSRGDRAALLTLAAPAEAPIPTPAFDLSAVRAAVAAVEPQASAADLPGAAALLKSLSTSEANAPLTLAALGAWRTGSLDVLPDTATPVTSPSPSGSIRVLASPPTEAPADNVAITAVEPLRRVLVQPESAGPLSSARTESIRVSLRRSGPGVASSALTTLRVRPLDQSTPDVAAFTTVPISWQPGQDSLTVAAAVRIPADAIAPGARGVLLQAEIDRDAIPGDNTFYRPVPARRALRVVIAAASRAPAARPSEFTAPEWFALALSPQTGVSAGALALAGSTEVRVTRVDAARLAAAELDGADALIITSPQLIAPPAPASGWSLVRRFADAGGLVIISPPAAPQPQTWTDAMIAALGLPWQIARDPRPFSPAVPLAVPSDSASPWLALLNAELAELLKPVTVSQLLPVTNVAPGQVILALADNTPLLLAAPPADTSSAPSSPQSNSSPPPAAPSPEPAAPEANIASSTPAARGLIVFWAAPPELAWTTLPAMPLMVPLTQELLRQGVGQALGSSVFTAGAALPVLPGVREWARVQGDGPTALSAAQPGAIRSASVYRALDASGATLHVAAWNADPRASRTTTQTPEQVRPALARLLGSAPLTWLAPPGDTDAPSPASSSPTDGESTVSPARALARDPQSTPIDLPLLAAALALGLLETALARWFSHARLARSTAAAPVPSAPASEAAA